MTSKPQLVSMQHRLHNMLQGNSLCHKNLANNEEVDLIHVIVDLIQKSGIKPSSYVVSGKWGWGGVMKTV